MALSNEEWEEPTRSPRAREVLQRALGADGLSARERWAAETQLLEHCLVLGPREEAHSHLESLREILPKLSTSTEPMDALRASALLEAYAGRIARLEGRGASDLAEHLAKLRDACGAYVGRLQSEEPRAGGVGFLHYAQCRFMLSEFVQLSVLVEGSDLGFERALEMLQRASCIASLGRALDAKPAPLAELRRSLLGPKHGIVIFLPEIERTQVLAFDAGHVLPAQAERRQVLRPLIRDFNRAIGRSPMLDPDKDRDTNRADLAKVSRTLSQALIPPQLAELMHGWRAITVIGADLLDITSFEALAWGDGSDIGSSFAIDTLPSLPVGVSLAQRAIAREAPVADAFFALIAAPAVDSKLVKPAPALPPLELAKSDEDELVAAYGSSHSIVRTGVAASPAALADPRVGGARVVQILAHGRYEATRERPAHLLLAPTKQDPSGRLWCEDVERLTSVARLVVLSACGAARSQTRYGEDGLNHLGGAFLRAGADCAVLSRGDIEMEATQRLLTSFHRRVRAGDTPAEAMRVARCDLAKNPRFAHPYYRSLLQVFGLGQRAVFR
jgi:hypothetical protein